ncbi:MAG: DNA-binding protein [Chthoniobacterales bacterium]
MAIPLRSAPVENVIETRHVQVERKTFHLEMRENERGQFLRITEEAHGRRNTIIIPSTGIADFTAAITETVKGHDRE